MNPTEDIVMPRYVNSALLLITMIVSLCLLGTVCLIPNVSAQTAENVMDDVLEIYEDIQNYAVRVQTYRADSMEVSESLFEGQPPLLTFDLFFRKPNEHTVQEIGISGYRILRVELLSVLKDLKTFEKRLQRNSSLLGEECYVLEFRSPHKNGDWVRLWVSRRESRVLQLTVFAKSVESITQFKYPLGKQTVPLPTETRTFLSGHKQVLINRFINYEVNTVLPFDIFDRL